MNTNIIVFPNGERRVPTGKWNDDLVIQYVLCNSHRGWLTTGELAEYVYGAKICRSSVRRNVPKLFWMFFRRHKKFLARKYGGKKKQVTHVKLIDIRSDEIQQLRKFVDKMWKKHEISAEGYEEVAFALKDLAEKIQQEDKKNG
jgi:hypothetical protein